MCLKSHILLLGGMSQAGHDDKDGHNRESGSEAYHSLKHEVYSTAAMGIQTVEIT